MSILCDGIRQGFHHEIEFIFYEKNHKVWSAEVAFVITLMEIHEKLLASRRGLAERISELEREVGRRPEDVALHLELGHLYKSTGDPDRAEKQFKKALSLQAGLVEIPVIEMEVGDEEALEIALVENLQRKDLTPFEEAEGYRALADRFAYTHEKIAEAVGKSRTVARSSSSCMSEKMRIVFLPAPVSFRNSAP